MILQSNFDLQIKCKYAPQNDLRTRFYFPFVFIKKDITSIRPCQNQCGHLKKPDYSHHPSFFDNQGSESQDMNKHVSRLILLIENSK